MYWCSHCQEYVEPDYSMTYRPQGVGRCPSCHLTVSGNHERPHQDYVNHGCWDVTSFGFVIGAGHTPTFDSLMTSYRELERAALNDASLLPRRDAAKAKAMAYLLDHKSLLIIEGH